MTELPVDREAQLNISSTNYQRVDVLLSQAKEQLLSDVTQSILIAGQAAALAERIGYTAGQAAAELALGKIHRRLGHYDISLLDYTKAETLFEKVDDRAGTARALLGIGFIYAELGEYASAQMYYMRGLDQAQGVSEEIESIALNNVATTYIDKGEYDRALEYLTKSLTLAQRCGNRENYNAVLDSAAELYLKMNRLNQALAYATESVNLARNSDPEIGDNLITLGKIYLEMGDYDQAMLVFQEAVQTSESTQTYRPIVRAWLMIGVTRRLQGRLDTSLEAISHAYQLAITEDALVFQYECLLELSKTYKQIGNFQLALEYYEQYHALKESVYNERSDMRLKTLEVLHQVENARQEAELYQLRNVELQHEITERLKIESTLEEMATRDELTGQFNRRKFIQLGEALLAQSVAGKIPLSFVLFDIDYFKQINDTFGHLAGDHALRAVADLINKVTRKIDVVSRLGGDEFAILLPETHIEQAYQVAERLRITIETTLLEFDQFTTNITLSLGVSETRPEDTSIDNLFARADKALYSAKQAGRNQVQVYTP